MPALVVVAAPSGPHAHTRSNHVCWYTLSACVRGPVEHIFTSLTSNARTRDFLSVVLRSSNCCVYASCTIPTCGVIIVRQGYARIECPYIFFFLLVEVEKIIIQ